MYNDDFLCIGMGCFGHESKMVRPKKPPVQRLHVLPGVHLVKDASKYEVHEV